MSGTILENNFEEDDFVDEGESFGKYETNS